VIFGDLVLWWQI